jgi:hypothetical protein
VQPNGTVSVPIASAFQGGLMAFSSSNGGVSWTASSWITGINEHAVAGGLRTSPLPSAAMDASGKIYLAWQDCRFEAACSANDIVMSTTTDGVHWSAVTRIPANQVGSGVDHFIPGIAVKPGTAGSSAQIALSYYYYPGANCASQTCQLDVGFVSSIDGGVLWSTAGHLAGPMSLGSIASTSQGQMVGDYIATTFAGGIPVPVFSVAKPASGGFDEYIAADPQSVSGGHSLAFPMRSRTGPSYNLGLFSETTRIPTAR